MRPHWQAASSGSITWNAEPVPELRGYPDSAAMLLDDQQADTQSGSGALAGFLGGETWIEAPVEQIGFDAGSPVKIRQRGGVLPPCRRRLICRSGRLRMASTAFQTRLTRT